MFTHKNTFTHKNIFTQVKETQPGLGWKILSPSTCIEPFHFKTLSLAGMLFPLGYGMLPAHWVSNHAWPSSLPTSCLSLWASVHLASGFQTHHIPSIPHLFLFSCLHHSTGGEKKAYWFFSLLYFPVSVHRTRLTPFPTFHLLRV